MYRWFWQIIFFIFSYLFLIERALTFVRAFFVYLTLKQTIMTKQKLIYIGVAIVLALLAIIPTYELKGVYSGTWRDYFHIFYLLTIVWLAVGPKFIKK